MIDAEKLKRLLAYSSESGEFTWLKTSKKAGNSHHTGYSYIKIGGKLYSAHRLAWLYMFGESPRQDLDHINKVRSDNRICNLRLASRVENNRNRGLNSNSKTGFKGVTLHRLTGRFQASASVAGRKKYIGLYDTPEEASKAYQEFAKVHHGAFYTGAEQS